jgi:hypothetical protein
MRTGGQYAGAWPNLIRGICKNAQISGVWATSLRGDRGDPHLTRQKYIFEQFSTENHFLQQY